MLFGSFYTMGGKDVSTIHAHEDGVLLDAELQTRDMAVCFRKLRHTIRDIEKITVHFKFAGFNSSKDAVVEGKFCFIEVEGVCAAVSVG